MSFKTAIIEFSIKDKKSNQLDIEQLRNFMVQVKDSDLILFSQDNLYFDCLNYLKDDFSQLKEKNLQIKNLFSNLAKEFSSYLSPGTIIEIKDDILYRTGLLFNPEGKLILEQRQLFLSKADKGLGLKRGVELNVIKTEIGRIGFIIGNDCWYPEVGRFLSLEGVDIVLSSTSLTDHNYWHQLAGIWSQVQQNQFFALEASTGGQSLIHGPCEITPFRTGIISPVGKSEDVLAKRPNEYLKDLVQDGQKDGTRLIVGELALKKLNEIRTTYPLKKCLNPRLYQIAGLKNMVLTEREGK